MSPSPTGDLPAPPDGTTCQTYGQGIWHPDSARRGVCALPDDALTPV